MKNDAERERLLDDVLSGPDEFRQALLSQTLRMARRRRQVRTFGRGALVVVFGALAVWWWNRSPAPQQAQTMQRQLVAAHSSYGVVQSHPPESKTIIETQTGVTMIVSSVGSAVAVIETEPGQHLFNEIGDDQLLSLLAGQPAALIREGPGRAEVLILDPRP